MDGYRINIIHCVNPHSMFVKSFKEDDEGFIQEIGLFGILPLNPIVAPDGIKTSIKAVKTNVNDWVPAATLVMTESFADAETVFFTPKLTVDSTNDITDRDTHIYGDIQLKDGKKMTSLLEILTKTYFAYRDDAAFVSELRNGKILPLTILKISMVKKLLENYLKDGSPSILKTKSKSTVLSEIYRCDVEKKILEPSLYVRDAIESLNVLGFDEGNQRDTITRTNTNIPKQDTDDDDYVEYRGPPDLRQMDLRQKVCIKKTKNQQSGSCYPRKQYHNQDSQAYLMEEYCEKPTEKVNTGVKNENEPLFSNRYEEISKINHVNKKEDHHMKVQLENRTKEMNKCMNVGQKKSNLKMIVERQMTSMKNKENSKQEANQNNQSIVNNIKNNNGENLKERKVVNNYKTSVLKQMVERRLKAGNVFKSENLKPKIESKVETQQVMHLSKLPQSVHTKFRDYTKRMTESSSSGSESLNVSLNSSYNFNESIEIFKNSKNYDSDNETTISCLVERMQLIDDAQSKPTDKLEKTNVVIESNVNVFQNINTGISRFIDRIVTPVLMVHTNLNTSICPILDFRDIKFNSEIRSRFCILSIKHPMMIQTVSWSNILVGRSLFMISPISSGKTVGYTPSVCDLVMDYTKCFPTGSGPIAIVLCATVSTVVDVGRQCKVFLGSKGKVVMCYPGLTIEDVTVQLTNGCEILVCTPVYLVKLLNSNPYGVDLNRLAICVLDECERLNEVFLNETKMFLLKIKETLAERAKYDRSNKFRVQYIVASRTWCDFMGPLILKTKSVLCMGAYHECVLYSKAQTSVNFVQSSAKLNSCLDFMNTIDNSKRTVIICNTNEEIKTVSDALTKLRYIVILADNSIPIDDIHKVSCEWDIESFGCVLVCCDYTLMHLNVTNAHYLFHYSLPNRFTMFCRRFSTLTNNYASIFDENRTENNVKIKILVDDSNVEQIPKIVNFIKRCATVPDVLNDLTERVLMEKDYKNAKELVPICSCLLSYGECSNFWHCEHRHNIFKTIDEPADWMPTSGVVTFFILYYHDVITYSARLMSNTVNDKTINYPQNYSTISDLGLYFINENHRIPIGVPKVGEFCAVTLKQDHFQRCRIIKVLNTNDRGHPTLVLVKLVDEEQWARARDVDLFHLPDKLKGVNSHVVKVKLSSLRPKDKDIIFSNLAKDYLKGLIEGESEVFMRAKVVLTISNTVIVSDLEVCQNLSSSKLTIVRYNIKEELLKLHAAENNDHLKKLQAICDKNGFVYSEVEEKVEVRIVKDLPKPSWAHLNSDEMSPVYFASADSPSKFFVRLSKFNDCLDMLGNDIQKYIKEGKASKISEVVLGDYVLAKFPDDNLFYRARIEEIVDDVNIKCFFVDHGDWRFMKKEDVFEIIGKFITVLPFQAIECRLVGLLPPSSDWPEFSTNWFCDLCFVGSSFESKDLSVKYCLKDKPDHTGGHKYAVIMMDVTTSKHICINQSMLQYNLANENNEEISYLNNFIELVINDGSTESIKVEEEVEEIERVNDVDIRTLTPIKESTYNFDDDLDLLDSFDIEGDKNDFIDLFTKRLHTPQVPSSDNFVKVDSRSSLRLETAMSEKSSDFEIVESTAVLEEIKADELKKCPTENNIRKPKLRWHQDKTNVYIKVELVGIEMYDIEIKHRCLKFFTKKDRVPYGFELELYGVIVPEKSRHSHKGLYVAVTLVKRFRKRWCELSKNVVKKNWIVYDVDSLSTDEDDDDEDYRKERENMKKVIESIHYKTDTETDGFDSGDDVY